MAYSQKYGEVTTEKGDLLPDEPVFIFRASDLLAMVAIVAYQQVCRQTQRPGIFMADLEHDINVFGDWRGPRKLPD